MQNIQAILSENQTSMVCTHKGFTAPKPMLQRGRCIEFIREVDGHEARSPSEVNYNLLLRFQAARSLGSELRAFLHEFLAVGGPPENLWVHRSIQALNG